MKITSKQAELDAEGSAIIVTTNRPEIINLLEKKSILNKIDYVEAPGNVIQKYKDGELVDYVRKPSPGKIIEFINSGEEE